MPEKEEKCVCFDHSLCRFTLLSQELLEMVPDLCEPNFGILALKSRMFSSNKLSIGFVVNDGGIVSPVDNYCESAR
jgi:hypothetical protein